MQLLSFIAQASIPNIDRYLTYIDKGQVTITEEQTLDLGTEVSVSVGGSAAKKVTMMIDDNELLRISCSCRKSTIRKPCAHALAAVSEYVNINGG